jgi:uncharacterized membrane protein
MRWLHIIAGVLGLISGAVALYALKGSKLHRKSGMIFVYTMLIMSATGALLAALKTEKLNVFVGLLTFYMVITALFTVIRPAQGFNWIDFAVMLFGLTVTVFGVMCGFEALNSSSGEIDGVPPAVPFIFGTLGLLAVLGDARIMLRGIHGAHRIARHLWRMCFALWIAVGSLFLGQPQVFPQPIRKFPFLVIPPLLMLLVTLYWLVRILFKRRRASCITFDSN